MDLSTRYLGFELPHPIVPGASPLVDDLDTVRRLEDAGAPMIVMHSLFEEQITSEEHFLSRAMESGADANAEASGYWPGGVDLPLGPEEYLEQIRRIKQAVAVPVVGSLNGATEGGWLEFARLMEQAGADALELNIYEVTTDLDESGDQVEARALRIARAVKGSVRIPVALKISPFYSSIAHFARRADEAGIDGLVLFNRFYQPDIDVDALEICRVQLSSPAELLLRLRWIAVLSGRVRASLAATGGVHEVEDVVKAVMAGAHVTQMVSALLARGPGHLRRVREGLAAWLTEREYPSLKALQGSMNLLRCPDPKLYERANYMKVLSSWAPRGPG